MISQELEAGLRASEVRESGQLSRHRASLDGGWVVLSESGRFGCAVYVREPGMTNPVRRPGPDSTLDDVRAALISAGARLLRERGGELGLATVTLSDTIADAGVARSTAYRSLAHDDLAPQAVLHQEILTQLLTRFSRTASADAINDAVSHELQLHDSAMENGTTADRTIALRSIIRVGANASYSTVVTSPERALLTAVYGALRSSPGPQDWRHQALIQGEANLNTMFTDLYLGLAELFQYDLRPHLNMKQFAAAAASLIEGIAMREGFNRHSAAVDRPTGPNGSNQEWSMFALGFEALFIGSFVPRNPESPFADLNSL